MTKAAPWSLASEHFVDLPRNAHGLLFFETRLSYDDTGFYASVNNFDKKITPLHFSDGKPLYNSTTKLSVSLS
jgi:hypothetical protein